MFGISRNSPSPRPGFTHVARARMSREGPVVALVSEIPESATALTRAAREAAARRAPLHVLDLTSSSPFEIDPGELSTPENADVIVSHLDPNAELAGYCRNIGAALVVVDTSSFTQLTQPGEPLAAFADGAAGTAIDVLVVQPVEQLAMS